VTEVDKVLAPSAFNLQPRAVFSLFPNFQKSYLRPVEEAYGDVRGADATAHIHRSLALVDHTSDFHGEMFLIFMYGQRSWYQRGNR